MKSFCYTWSTCLAIMLICIAQSRAEVDPKTAVGLCLFDEGTGKKPEVEIEKLVRQHFPLTPKEIIKTLNLRRAIYLDTARYGHFGRPDLPWEKPDKVDDLR